MYELTLKEDEDGNLWHAKETEQGIEYLLDENGMKISSSICLCFAHEPSECVCACTSWRAEDYDTD